MKINGEWAKLVEKCFEAWKKQNQELNADDVRGTTRQDLRKWIIANRKRGVEPFASLKDIRVIALTQALQVKCIRYGLWYAVQRDSEDPWDDGYDSEMEAIKAANRQGCDIIAVIDITHADPFCIRELHRGVDF